MKIKYFEHGKIRLYIMPDSPKSKEDALKLVRAYGYSFYPNATEIGKNILSECCIGRLLKKEKLSADSVCTVSEKLYSSLELPFTELEIPNDTLTPFSISPKEKKESIADKSLVFIAGRGIGSKSNYERLRSLAYKFNAGLGCTRPIAMNGWESYDNAVGISGNILNADTAVCFGASGSMPFIKGIENCKTIIAINSNKDAMIFDNADYSLVDDCMNVISYLESL